MAKQKEDQKTMDLFGERRPRGRPRRFASAAEKQAAYRARCKVLKAQKPVE